jgi:hypothetical protein
VSALGLVGDLLAPRRGEQASPRLAFGEAEGSSSRRGILLRFY